MSSPPNSQIVILPAPRAQTSVQSSDIRERPPPPPPRPPLLGPTYSLTLQSPPPVFSGRNQMAHPPHDPYYLQQQPPLPPQQQDFSDRSVINTLFVSGLPDDVKAREIHNLFRRRPGFDSCQLKYTGRGNQVVAFATFFNHQSAMAALHSLNGVKFDPQTGSLLHIELARSNSRRKRKPGSGAYVVIDKRTKKEADTQETSSDDGDSETDEPSETENNDSGDKTELETTKSAETAVDSDNAVATVNEQSEKHVDGGPCSTLFIANLGPNCTEDELKQVLSKYPGFNVIKLRAKGGMPVAFADFEEIEQANKAMDELRGNSLPSSDRGGMHIEYARSKMRKS
ncbi:PREDICTED: U2 small nuclear ribonucleo [Prunus dulcis]|uniref:PREDICTED: U2 small nuclear ribonucleo n=1 Tax=Prunus dulcis TaxID=3755 RepID=A0A5E4FF47_PRUDU|nr:U2 small nuclear ribonucleoprotein B'' isoform X1 [Prunus dulcis]VVA24248.1 PREDICTED: U2 small nuclear ribonucleo [Prunus dulcis]